MMSEVKIKEGERLEDFEVKGYRQEAHLRSDHAEGGIIVWIKSNKGLNMEVWESLSSSEKVWLKFDSGFQKFAICQVYLRTNKGKDHIHYSDNRKVLEQLREEVQWFEARDFGVVILGDFNAHTGNEPVLGFKSHTHDVNNNGALLINFCKEMNLSCLNTIPWINLISETPTFRRDFGHGFIESIIDYGLVSQNLLPSIEIFEVQTDKGLEMDSDHATMFLKIRVKFRKVEQVQTTHNNQLRRIRKWDCYKRILDKQMQSQGGFEGLSSDEQERWLKGRMRAAGMSLTSPINNAGIKKRRLPKDLEVLNKNVRVARRIYNSLNRNLRSSEENSILWKQWQDLRKRFKAKFYINQLRVRRKTRALLRARGPKAQKLFWNLVAGNNKRKVGIDILEENGTVYTEPEDKIIIVEKFFVKKFKASESKPNPLEEPNDDEVTTSRLGKPSRVLSHKDAYEIRKPLTLLELESNMKELDESKAEGNDGITNAMIKNLPDNAKLKLMEIYNNILLSGCVPEDWKAGEVILVLKKNPPSDIENYRPITLISCISKLLTKIMAKRISAAVESSRILGPEQQGFRKGRKCEDNIFILNSLLAKREKKKLVSHLMFLDLKEAYDRVDRPSLYKKLSQMNFPKSFIDFLQSYYSNDYISSASAGRSTGKLYLTRGLRQGCNLSAILFVLYMSELGNRLRRAGVGIELTENLLLSFLKFADDILLLSGLWSEMMFLVRIVEKWCVDFKMVISVIKTKVVTPSNVYPWKIMNLLTNAYEDVEKLEQFKYLGLLQKFGANATISCNAINKLEKANMYKRNILRIKRLIPDRVDVYLAMWKNIALPSILYGLEAIPFDRIQEEKLEQIQISLGKCILGVRDSTANVVVYSELGLKPVSLLISERKIRFVLTILGNSYKGSELVKLIMNEHLSEKNSPFYTDLGRRLNPINLKPENISKSSVNFLLKKEVEMIKNQIAGLKSLNALPLPKVWWRKQLYIRDETWSRILTEFRCGNARLGNRDNSLTEVAVHNGQGRVVNCPLCLLGPNNESHLLIGCPAMGQIRKSLLVSDKVSLDLWITTNRRHNLSNTDLTKMFLGEEGDLKLGDFVSRGYLLLDLRESFLMKIYERLDL